MASTALAESRALQAELYAPESFAQAAQLVTAARSEMAQQRATTALLRRYGEARRLLEASEAAIETTRAEASAAVLEARRSATASLAEAHGAVDRVAQAFWRSPRGKDTRSDLLRMQADLSALRSALTEAEVAQEQGDYLSARARAEHVAREALLVERTIERAMAHLAEIYGAASAQEESTVHSG